ncbi:hypothetical protein [Amphibacillus sediminis]|uniref:hypothetical protein n=1 Tax=Amphibacillus sediminis TaxID=360185 RepID=UPI000829984A|nr:hypothetical protein [Amphibacillus sediminis]
MSEILINDNGFTKEAALEKVYDAEESFSTMSTGTWHTITYRYYDRYVITGQYKYYNGWVVDVASKTTISTSLAGWYVGDVHIQDLKW